MIWALSLSFTATVWAPVAVTPAPPPDVIVRAWPANVSVNGSTAWSLTAATAMLTVLPVSELTAKVGVVAV